MKEQDKPEVIFHLEYLHVICGIEGVCIWNVRSKLAVDKPLAFI